MNDRIIELGVRYPALRPLLPDVESFVEKAVAVFRNGGTLYLCGNGGSAADAEHIAGELLKGFLRRRPPSREMAGKLAELYGREGEELARGLQCGIRCISLLSHPGLLSAFCNDVNPEYIYAQQLFALAKPGDMLLGITCSGNARNVDCALMTARAMGVETVLLTGAGKGRCVAHADLVLAVPEKEVFKIQELHLPVYHAFCAAVESELFT